MGSKSAAGTEVQHAGVIDTRQGGEQVRKTLGDCHKPPCGDSGCTVRGTTLHLGLT